MSGPKAYTMREMKVIVEYLAEHKAYGELKGRKMWVDFSNSSLTNRTWQSLKETFLKRILPDIQNPYYGLNREQVLSFKHGYDVEEKEKNNRLEIIRSEEPNKDAETKKVSEQQSPNGENQNEVDNAPGEDFKSEKISTRNRSSAETFILDDNTSKPIDNFEDLTADEQTAKTMKECLAFEHSEPSSIVRAVLEDFGTDSDDSGGLAMVVDDVEVTDANANIDTDQDIILVEDSENAEDIAVRNENAAGDEEREMEKQPISNQEVITDLTDDLDKDKDVNNAQKQNHDSTELETSDNTNASHDETVQFEIEPDQTDEIETTKHAENQNMPKPAENDNNNENSVNSSNDTIIPNNQELNNEVAKTNGIETEIVAAPRKRSTSQEISASKKIKLADGPEKVNEDIDPPANSIDTEAVFDALKNAEPTKDIQGKDESHINPCLKSVSLFEEQFNTTKYTDSDEDDTPIPKNDVIDVQKSVTNSNVEKSVQEVDQADAVMIVDSQKEVNNQAPANIEQVFDRQTNKKDEPPIVIQNAPTDAEPLVEPKEEVIELNSDSDEEEAVLDKLRLERYKRIEQAFGFVPGTSTTARHRKKSVHKRQRTRSLAHSRGRRDSSDLDSNFSDANDAELFVSPPQGRHHRLRRYQKPVVGRMLSSDENGRVYVLFGNNVVSLMADDGRNLRYVNYDVSDDEERTWKLKYIDERKKAADLKRQLELAKSTSADAAPAASSRPKSPVAATSQNGGEAKTVTAIPSTSGDCKLNIVQGESGKVQITLSNHSQQKINLEGFWPQVLPMMEQVMGIFYKTDTKQNVNGSGNEKPVEEKELKDQQKDKQIADISGLTTPVIPTVNTDVRKVDDIERQIFKEIEERDKQEENKEKPAQNNATKRKARNSNSTESVKVPLKKTRKSKQSLAKPELVKEVKPELTKNDSQSKTTAVRLSTDIKEVDTSPNKNVATAPTKEAALSANTEVATSPNKEVATKPKKEVDNNLDNKEQDKETKRVRKTSIPPLVPRVTRSRKSGNDTDTSSSRPGSRSKRLSVQPDESVRYMLPPGPKTRKSNTKTTPPKTRSLENPHELSQDCSRHSIDSTQGYQDSDVSPTNYNITKRKKKLSIVVKKGRNVRRRSFTSATIDETLNSSDSSYFVPRKSITEPTLQSVVYKTESYQILMGNRRLSVTNLEPIDEKNDDSGHFKTESKLCNDSVVIEVCSSSNVSLPLSPELSVVDNLSISREMIQNVDHPTINEQQANDSIVSDIYNQYLIADVDISVPLMQQDCELLDTPKKTAMKKLRVAKSPIKVSDLLNKLTNVDMSVDNTLSETLDQKLRDLLLDSAKKTVINANMETNKENLMEVDQPATTIKKSRKKRCSTPCKKGKKKTKVTVGPVLDEHTESCSFNGGRNSCPPLSTFIPLDENANNSADVNLKNKKPTKPKKDIIKVKIQRPTKPVVQTQANTSQTSLCTDSGINESVSMNENQGSDDVELIHNHSDTCLQAHECVGNSVEFVDKLQSQSIISLSTESLESELLNDMNDMDKLSEASKHFMVDNENDRVSQEIFATPASTMYHSPAEPANSSLITEDLSEESHLSPPTKWYLLSEDETNTCHNVKPELVTSNTRCYNYLKLLFPETCAVPDLSTISEMSRENEDSRKSSEDTRSNGFIN